MVDNSLTKNEGVSFGLSGHNPTCRRFEPFSVWLLGWAAFVTVAIDLSSRLAETYYTWPGILLTLLALTVSLPVTWAVFKLRRHLLIRRDPNLKQLKESLEELMIQTGKRGKKEISDDEVLSAFDTSCHDHVNYLIGKRKHEKEGTPE